MKVEQLSLKIYIFLYESRTVISQQLSLQFYKSYFSLKYIYFYMKVEQLSLIVEQLFDSNSLTEIESTKFPFYNINQSHFQT